jgi:hypothetical protein
LRVSRSLTRICIVRTACPVRYAANCRGSCSSSRTRTGTQGFVSGFQSGNRLFARHRGKRLEKLIKGMSAFEIVDEIPQRHVRISFLSIILAGCSS